MIDPAPGAAPDPAPDDLPVSKRGADEAGWRRLHPASPLLRGGIVLIVVFGWILSQMWNRIVEFLSYGLWQGQDLELEDPGMSWIQDTTGLPVLLVVAGATLVLAILIGLGFYLQWRFLTFRVTDEVVELREGVLRRRHRQARLDRVQSINIVRPALARLLGAAVLDIEGAGEGAGIKLQYLRSKEVDALRAEILDRASGAKRRADGHVGGADGQWAPVDGAATPDGSPDAPAGAAEPGTKRPQSRMASLGEFIRTRVDELQQGEIDASRAAPGSIVTLPVGRLVASVALEIGIVLVFVVLFVGIVTVLPFAIYVIVGADEPGDRAGFLAATPFIAIGFVVPAIAVLAGIIGGKVVPNLRYDIEGTTDGVRIVRGLLTTTSETLPPGRVHAIDVRQPVYWRPFGWWEVRVTRAGGRPSAEQGGQNAQQQRRNIVLPVGTRADVERVLALFLPTRSNDVVRRIVDDGLVRPAQGDGYVRAPSRSRWLHPFQYRRLGYVVDRDTLYIRRGALTRRLSIAPAERFQSVSARQGPLARGLRIASVHAHTVTGVVDTKLPAVDADRAIPLLNELVELAVRAAANDSTHRWAEAAARTAVVTARMRVDDAQRAGRQPDATSLAVLGAAEAFAAYEAAQAGGLDSDGGAVGRA